MVNAARSSELNANFYAVRHPLSIHNRIPQRFQSSDASLSKLGYMQAHQTAMFFKRRLEGSKLIIVSSDTKRTRQTTGIFTDMMKPLIEEVIYDDRIRERDPGTRLHGLEMPLDTLNERQIDAMVVGAGGESMRQLWNRVNDFVIGIKAESSRLNGFSIIIVTHEFPLKAMAGISTGQGMEESIFNGNRFCFKNASISTGVITPSTFRFQNLGDTSHLAKMLPTKTTSSYSK
ncbi:hypothetical protein DRN67_02505 [Candidatus Micrarchaeota archaeon]|nr:MAG: hypothetical protein DRN67_02505 [Candidatus Micrarchaeota archaeon]